MAAAVPPKPRYAPEDPTLPKPWRGLVDGATGNLYFWNPITKVTQYERPVSDAGDAAGADPAPPPSSTSPPASYQAPVDIDTAAADEEPKPCSPDGGSRDDHMGSEHAELGSSFDCSGGGYDGVRSSIYAEQEDSCFDRSGGGCDDTRSSMPVGQGYQSAGAGTQQSARAYCLQHEITVVGGNAPAPYTTFESAGFPMEILREVRQAGFSAPTPIQAQSWPIALDDRDIVAVAKTGSGKTLGYLIPGFIHIKRMGKNPQIGPSVLVLSPTRELATQIQEQAEKFGKPLRLSSVCLYGGAPKGPQLRDLQRGVHIVVATPGRLNDILEMKKVNLDQITYLVLDEADRMLDMGFEPQIRKIVKQIPHRHQTLMFTATWPREVRKIAADLLVNAVQVNIGNIDELVANKSITQHVEMISPMEKRRRLNQILQSQEPGSKIIIFCSTKRMCDQLAGMLGRDFGANAIHGDKSQSDRDWVLNEFRTGKSPVLVATDVAARGLDIKDIRVVVNYDFPTGVEDYVHRIGRTGRAGATGVAYTFFCDQDFRYAAELVKILEGADQHVPSELRNGAGRGGGYGGGGRSRRWSSDGDSYGGYGGGEANHSFGGGGSGRSPPRDSGGYGSSFEGNDRTQGGSGESGYSGTSFHWSMYGGQ